MTLSITVLGTPIPNVAPTSVEIASAANWGEAVFSGFEIDDATAAFMTVGHKPCIIEESDCSQSRLFTGWVTQRDVGRSVERGMFPGESARKHDVTIVDLNAMWNFRIITGTDAKRPAEPMIDRVTWLLGSEYMSGLISTGTAYIPTYTAMMEAADYRGSYPSSVMQDCVERFSERINYFAFWEPTAGTPMLFLGLIDDAIYESTLSISNVPADVDNITVFAPDVEAVLQREPDEVYSTVLVNYGNGSRTVMKRATTAADYIERGYSYTRPFTTRLSEARDYGTKFLDRHANELDRIKCSIVVAPDTVGLLTAGQRMDVKFSHLPGYATWTSMRVISCIVRPVDDVINRYRMDLELVAPRAGSSPVEPACSYTAPTLEDPSSNDIFGASIAADGTFAAGSAYPVTTQSFGQNYQGAPINTYGTPNDGDLFGTYSDVVGWSQTLGVYYVWDLQDIGTPAICHYRCEWMNIHPGVVTIDGSNDGTAWTNLATDTTGVIDTSVADPYVSYRYMRLMWEYEVVGGLQYVGGVDFKFLMLWSGSSAEADVEVDLPPESGSTVVDERPVPVADGSTTSFTVAGPYLPGTLRVFVDGIAIPSSLVTETDPVAGTFALAWAPDTDERISVLYVAG